MASLDLTAKTSDEIPTQALRVLVVDENEADRQNTVLHLGQAWPFERELVVEFADDGQRAVEKLAASRFSLIVFDWKVPEMLGGDLLRTFRRAGARTPVVIVSDLRRHQIRDDIEALGAAFVNREELDSVNLRDAIASSLRMLGRLSLADTTTIHPKTSAQSATRGTPPPAQ